MASDDDEGVASYGVAAKKMRVQSECSKCEMKMKPAKHSQEAKKRSEGVVLL
jgi:hypothetical protein